MSEKPRESRKSSRNCLEWPEGSANGADHEVRESLPPGAAGLGCRHTVRWDSAQLPRRTLATAQGLLDARSPTCAAEDGRAALDTPPTRRRSKKRCANPITTALHPPPYPTVCPLARTNTLMRRVWWMQKKGPARQSGQKTWIRPGSNRGPCASLCVRFVTCLNVRHTRYQLRHGSCCLRDATVSSITSN
jgi:hypothetical protein